MATSKPPKSMIDGLEVRLTGIDSAIATSNNAIATKLARKSNMAVPATIRDLGALSPSLGSSVTGAIKIELPAWTNAMLSFKVTVFNYATGTSFEALISGYLYDSTTSWLNVSAVILGTASTRHTVRFGIENSKPCVWIGEVATVWSYPQVQVTEVVTGYSGDVAALEVPWIVTMDTVFGTIQQTITSSLEAETIGGRKLWTGTQAAYDAIVTKDANTIYFIT